MKRGVRVVSFLREHAFGCAICLAGLFWGLDAQVHTSGGGEGYLEHLFSTEGHTVAPRLFISALLVSLAFLVQAVHRHRRSEAQVKASELRFRTLTGSAPVGVFECDAAGRVVYINDRASALVGLPAAACLGEGLATTLHEDDRTQLLQQWGEAVRQGLPFRVECRFIHRDAKMVSAIFESVAILGEAGGVSGFIGTITDISDRVKTEAELMERTRLAELNAAVGLILTEEASLPGMIQRCVQTMVTHLDALFARIWLYDSREEVLVLRASAGQYTHLDGAHARIPLGSMKIGVIASERKPRLTNQVVGDPLVSDQEWARREGVTAFAGNPLVVGSALVGVLGIFSRHPLSTATSDWLSTIASEVALGIQRKHYEEQLQSAAFNDELTGLFNRRGFFTLAGKQVEVALRGGYAVGVVYIDLNRFKELNDRWGHKEGDAALRDVADILRAAFRKSDILGRIGGDEFVVFLSEVRDVGAQRTILSNLRQQLSEYNARAERPFTLELSAGVAFSGAGVACSLEELLLRADRDMYREKRLGRGRGRTPGQPVRSGQTRRLTPRVPLEGVAAAVSPGGTAEVEDISLGGVCLRTPVPLQIRSVCALQLPAEGSSRLHLSAEVLWAEEIGGEPRADSRFRSGLRFVAVDGRLTGVVSDLAAGHC